MAVMPAATNRKVAGAAGTATRTKPKPKPKPKRTAKPKPAPAPTPLAVTMPFGDLKRLVRTVTPAASTDEARPVLCGVLVETTPTGLRMTATDSYRLHRATIVPAAAVGDMSALVPAAWLAAQVKQRHGVNAEVTLTIDDKCATIRTGSEVSFTTLIGGKYPDIDKLLTDTAPVTPTPEAAVAFNPRYLSQLLAAAQVFGGDTYPARVEHLDATKPCRFVVDAKSDRFGEFILMPVRVW